MEGEIRLADALKRGEKIKESKERILYNISNLIKRFEKIRTIQKTRKKLPRFNISVGRRESYLHLLIILEDFFKRFKMEELLTLFQYAYKNSPFVVLELPGAAKYGKVFPVDFLKYPSKIDYVLSALELSKEFLINMGELRRIKDTKVKQLFEDIVWYAYYVIKAMGEDAFKQENILSILKMCRDIIIYPFFTLELKNESRKALNLIFKAFIPLISKHKERPAYSKILNEYEKECERIEKFLRKELENGKNFENIYRNYIKLSYLKKEYTDIQSEKKLKEWIPLLPARKCEFAHQVVAYKNSISFKSLPNILYIAKLEREFLKSVYKVQAQRKEKLDWSIP